MKKVFRFILTLALVYLAYTETGIFTALSLLLIFVSFEVQGWLTKQAVCVTSGKRQVTLPDDLSLVVEGYPDETEGTNGTLNSVNRKTDDLCVDCGGANGRHYMDCPKMLD